MASKIDQDRAQDANIKTDTIDLGDLDKINFDDPMLDPFIEEGKDNKPDKPLKVAAKNAAKGFAGGIATGAYSELSKHVPSIPSIQAEIEQTYSEFRQMKDELSRELGPMIASLENSTRKVLPMAQKFMPKGVYQKIHKKLEDRHAARAGYEYQAQSKQQMEEAQISDTIAQIFGAQVESDKSAMLEQKKQEITDQALEAARHKKTSAQLAQVYAAARSTELFHRTIHTAYLRKSLELKYKHLFIARDTFNLLNSKLGTFELYYKSILRNSSLPDSAKTISSDAYRSKIARSFGQTYNKFIGSARAQLMKNITNKVKDFRYGLKDIVDQVAFAADSASMAGNPLTGEVPVLNPMELLPKLIAYGGGKLIGGGLTKRLAQTISPFLGNTEAALSNVKGKAMLKLAKVGRQWRADPRYGGLLSFLGNLIPNLQETRTAGNDLVNKPDEPATFDVMTRQSIVEIIPGLLSKILQSQEKLRTGREDVEEQVYNVYSREFGSVKDLQKGMEEKLYGAESTRKANFITGLATLQAGVAKKSPDVDTDDFYKKYQKDINRFFANHAVFVQFFNPTEIAEYIVGGGQNPTPYIRSVTSGFDHNPLEVLTAIYHGITKADGKTLDKYVIRDIENTIMNYRRNDAYKQELPKMFETYGYRRFYSDGMNAGERDALVRAANAGDAQAKAKLKSVKGIVGTDDTINLDRVAAMQAAASTLTKDDKDIIRGAKASQLNKYMDLEAGDVQIERLKEVTGYNKAHAFASRHFTKLSEDAQSKYTEAVLKLNEIERGMEQRADKAITFAKKMATDPKAREEFINQCHIKADEMLRQGKSEGHDLLELATRLKNDPKNAKQILKDYAEGSPLRATLTQEAKDLSSKVEKQFRDVKQAIKDKTPEPVKKVLTDIEGLVRTAPERATKLANEVERLYKDNVPPEVQEKIDNIRQAAKTERDKIVAEVKGVMSDLPETDDETAPTEGGKKPGVLRNIANRLHLGGIKSGRSPITFTRAPAEHQVSSFDNDLVRELMETISSSAKEITNKFDSIGDKFGTISSEHGTIFDAVAQIDNTLRNLPAYIGSAPANGAPTGQPMPGADSKPRTWGELFSSTGRKAVALGGSLGTKIGKFYTRTYGAALKGAGSALRGIGSAAASGIEALGKMGKAGIEQLPAILSALGSGARLVGKGYATVYGGALKGIGGLAKGATNALFGTEGIGSGGGLVGMAGRGLKGLGKGGLLKKGFDLYSGLYGKAFDLIGGGLKGVGKMASSFINRLFGFDVGGTNKRMLELVSLIQADVARMSGSDRAPGDADGDGDVDGSYADQQQKKNEAVINPPKPKSGETIPKREVSWRRKPKESPVEVVINGAEGAGTGNALKDWLFGKLKNTKYGKNISGKLGGVLSAGKGKALAGLAGLSGLFGKGKVRDVTQMVVSDAAQFLDPDMVGDVLPTAGEVVINPTRGGAGRAAGRAARRTAGKARGIIGKAFAAGKAEGRFLGRGAGKIAGAVSKAGVKTAGAIGKVAGKTFLAPMVGEAKLLGGAARTVGKAGLGLARNVWMPVAGTAGKLALGAGKGLLATGAHGLGALMGGLGGLGSTALAAAPWLAGAAALGYGGYRAVKGFGKDAAAENLGKDKRDITFEDRLSSALGMNTKTGAKIASAVVDANPIVGLIKYIRGNDNPMTQKEVENCRGKLQNKVKKGLPGYDKILSEYEKAVEDHNWSRARQLGGKDYDSLVKTLWDHSITGKLTNLGIKWMFGDKNEEMKKPEVEEFRARMQKIIAKGGSKAKNAERILSRFDDAVAEGDWKTARKFAGKENRGIFGKLFQDSQGNVQWTKIVGTALGGPVGYALGWMFTSTDKKKPMTPEEVQKETKRLQELVDKGNKPAAKVLKAFQEAVEMQDWEKARKLVGKEVKSNLAKVGDVLYKTAGVASAVGTLGLTYLFALPDQSTPMTEAEINKFRKKMEYQISKGDPRAERKLEKFDEYVSRQNWEKARAISKMPDEMRITKIARNVKNWLIGSDESEMTMQEMTKFRESMQRKIKMGNTTAQKKLEAFEDAVAGQKWRRARAIAQMPDNGVVGAVGKGLAKIGGWIFGGNQNAMSDAEIEKARKEMSLAIKDGKQGAQRRLDMFEDYVADEKWEKARRLAKMPYKNVLKRTSEALKNWWLGNNEGELSGSEIEKFQGELEQRIKDGDQKAARLLEEFNDAVEEGRWKKARRISQIKSEGAWGVVKKHLTKFKNFFTGDSDYDNCMELRDQLEDKALDDETGAMNTIIEQFETLVRRRKYNEAADLAKGVLAMPMQEFASKYNPEQAKKNVETAKKLEARINKAKSEISAWAHPIKRFRLARLMNRLQDTTEWDEDTFSEISDDIDEITGEGDFAELDDRSPDLVKKVNNFLKEVKTRRAAISAWKHPIDAYRLGNLVSAIEASPSDWDEGSLESWQEQLKEIDPSYTPKKEEEKTEEKPKPGEKPDIEVSTKSAQEYYKGRLEKEPWLANVDFPGDPDEEREAKREWDLKNAAQNQKLVEAAKEEKKPAVEAAATAGVGKTQEVQAKAKTASSSDKIIKDYVQSIGGEDKVRSMKADEFLKGLRDYSMNNLPDDMKGASKMRLRAYESKMRAYGSKEYAKIMGVVGAEGGSFTMRGGKLIDPKTNEPVSLGEAPKSSESTPAPATMTEAATAGVGKTAEVVKAAETAPETKPAVEAAAAKPEQQKYLDPTSEEFQKFFEEHKNEYMSDELKAQHAKFGKFKDRDELSKSDLYKGKGGDAAMKLGMLDAELSMKGMTREQIEADPRYIELKKIMTDDTANKMKLMDEFQKYQDAKQQFDMENSLAYRGQAGGWQAVEYNPDGTVKKSDGGGGGTLRAGNSITSKMFDRYNTEVLGLNADGSPKAGAQPAAAKAAPAAAGQTAPAAKVASNKSAAEYYKDRLDKEPWLADVDFPGDPDEEREAKAAWDLKNKAQNQKVAEAATAGVGKTAPVAKSVENLKSDSGSIEVTAEKRVRSATPSQKIVDEYISQLGGEDKVRGMSQSDFLHGLEEYALNNLPNDVKNGNASKKKFHLIKISTYGQKAYSDIKSKQPEAATAGVEKAAAIGETIAKKADVSGSPLAKPEGPHQYTEAEKKQILEERAKNPNKAMREHFSSLYGIQVPLWEQREAINATKDIAAKGGSEADVPNLLAKYDWYKSASEDDKTKLNGFFWREATEKKPDFEVMNSILQKGGNMEDAMRLAKLKSENPESFEAENKKYEESVAAQKAERQAKREMAAAAKGAKIEMKTKAANELKDKLEKCGVPNAKKAVQRAKRNAPLQALYDEMYTMGKSGTTLDYDTLIAKIKEKGLEENCRKQAEKIYNNPDKMAEAGWVTPDAIINAPKGSASSTPLPAGSGDEKPSPATVGVEKAATPSEPKKSLLRAKYEKMTPEEKRDQREKILYGRVLTEEERAKYEQEGMDNLEETQLREQLESYDSYKSRKTEMEKKLKEKAEGPGLLGGLFGSEDKDKYLDVNSKGEFVSTEEALKDLEDNWKNQKAKIGKSKSFASGKSTKVRIANIQSDEEFEKLQKRYRYLKWKNEHPGQQAPEELMEGASIDSGLFIKDEPATENKYPSLNAATGGVVGSPATASIVAKPKVQQADVAMQSPAVQASIVASRSANANGAASTVDAASAERDKKYDQLLEQNQKLLAKFDQMVDKDGLKVAGMGDLIEVSSAQPAASVSNTTIVNQAPGSNSEGLDLRKVQA